MGCNDSDENQQRIIRRRGACKLCREKKVRCNGRKPCTFCEKRQATCLYSSSPSKPASEVSHQTRASQPTPKPSSRDPKTPGPTTTLGNDKSANSQATERPSNFRDPDQPPWTDMTDFGGLDDGNNYFDFIFDSSVCDPQQSTNMQPPSPLLRPPTSNKSGFDMSTSDWTMLSWQQGELEFMNMLARKSNLYSLDDDAIPISRQDQMAEPIVDPLSPIAPIDFGEYETLNRLADLESPAKRHRVLSQPPSPIAKRKDRRRSVFSPPSIKISADNRLASYNPHISVLFQKSQKDEQPVGESRINMVSRVAAKLLSRTYLLGLPKSLVKSSVQEVDQEPSFFVENFSSLSMPKLFDLCFNEPWGVRCFLDKSDILRVFHVYMGKEAEGDQNRMSVTDIFLLSIIATWGATLDTREEPGQELAMVTQVMGLRQYLLLEPDSVTKFLGLVVTAQYAMKFGVSQLPAIIAETVSVVQSLKLHLESGLESACPIPASRIYAKRACWVLYSIDKTYAMRWRTFSLLPSIEHRPPSLSLDDYHGHRPPQLDGQEEDWLISQCRYASLCARVSKGLFASASGAALTSDPTHDYDEPSDKSTSTEETDTRNQSEKVRELLVHNLLMDLNSWYESVPEEGRQVSCAKGASTQSSQRQMAIITSYQYYEMVLAALDILSQSFSIPFPSALRLPSLASSTATHTSLAASILLDSIKGVLTSSYHISNNLDDRILLHVPTLALCTLAVENVRGNLAGLSTQRESRTLFAMAYGFFGRVSVMLPHDEFFDRVTELFGAVNMA
ncbi:hypothetical protein DL98DRAFT_612108 [Cadophora sp. DSE1049]|nr:hypothetical protein DL98DRAFT_612108 [Cadophora sp. DSE1049]